VSLIVFLATRTPPASPLFPYTTLFRSVVAPQSLKTPVTSAQAIPEQWTAQSAAKELLLRWPEGEPELVLEALDLSSLWPLTRRRSEEHTSELQSRENLVCRLLLEKKKK